jgi:hypothetical protein
VDWRRPTFDELRQHYDYRQSAVNVGVASQLIVGADSRRVGLLIHDQGGTGDVHAGPERQLNPGQGLPVGTLGQGEIHVWFPRWGILPMVEWWGDSTGGLATVYVLEVLWR